MEKQKNKKENINLSELDNDKLLKMWEDKFILVRKFINMPQKDKDRFEENGILWDLEYSYILNMNDLLLYKEELIKRGLKEKIENRMQELLILERNNDR